MVLTEKIAIVAVLGLAIGISAVSMSMAIRKGEESNARRSRICADFERNKQIWIAEGMPGGYEVMRSMLEGDDLCRAYSPRTMQQ